MLRRLPPEVLQRLRDANMNGVESKKIVSYVLDINKNQCDEGKEPGLIDEMKKNGFSVSFCDFILNFLGRLKEEQGSVLSPSDAANMARKGIKIDNSENLVKIIRAMDEEMRLRKNFKMRMNQIAALLTLLFGSSDEAKGHLLELATGEGKSCVIAFFATLQALQGKTVDIICSSHILAQRDENDWKDFYKAFGLSSASLPVAVQDDESYKKVYSKNIVYGTVHDFTADVLKQEFDGKDTRGARKYNSLIVDEVDHLTLDSCLSTTYLSHHARGMHHINTVLVAVWQLVTTMLPLEQGFYLPPQYFLSMAAALLGTEEKGGITDLDVLHKLVFEKRLLPESSFADVQKHLIEIDKYRKEEQENSLEEIEALKKTMWTELKHEIMMMNADATLEDNISSLVGALSINSNIYILDEDNKPKQSVSEKGCKNNLLIFPNGMISIFYQESNAKKLIEERVMKVITSTADENKMPKEENSLHIPTFLHSHVQNILPEIINKGFTAAYHMEEGVAYKIAKSDKATSEASHMFDSIIPVDFDSTGVLEKNKKYSEIQQFLEMKHSLNISDATVTTNFMSNFSFYTRFAEIHGLSGTLGNKWDKIFLEEKLQLQSSSIPSNKKNLVRYYPMEVVQEDVWLSSILQETDNACRKGQPVLLICKDIKTAEGIFKEISSSLSKANTIAYWRDDNHSLPLEVCPGQIVISTTLASRGTDIKVSEKAIKNGGLHVLLTYLPKDTRTERQIVGRTGRKGLPGSTRQIISREKIEEQLMSNNLLEEDIKSRRDMIEANRVQSLDEKLGETLFNESLFQLFCEKKQEFSKWFTFLETKNTGECFSKYELRILLENLKKRKLDYAPAMDAFKESWALWFNANSGITADKDKRHEVTSSLQSFLDLEIKNLKKGITNNFYQYIAHAMGRSKLYEYNKEKESIISAGFVTKAWEMIEDKTCSQDSRYLSAAHYNYAHAVIQSKSGSYIQKALTEVKKAKESLRCRIEDNIVETNCMMSFQSTGMFPSHTSLEENSLLSRTNLDLQNENRGVMLQSFYNNCEELLSKLESLEKEGGDIKEEYKDVNSLFKEDKDPILTSELSLFIADGHFQLFDVEKEPIKGFCWNGLWCFLLGVGQVIGGIAVCTFAPAFSSFGMNLIMEGISDCYEGIKGMATGVFSWVQWAIAKAISIAVSILAFGINKTFKWVKEGGKFIKGSGSKIVGGFTKTGAKQSLNQALKYTAKQAILKTAVHFAGEGFDVMVKEAFEKIFEDIKQSIKKKLQNSQKIRNVLVSAWLSHLGTNENQNILHEMNSKVMKQLKTIVLETFNTAQKGSDKWIEFSSQLRKYSSPLFDIADKTVCKGNTAYGEIASKIVTATTSITTAIWEGKELIKVAESLEEDLAKKLQNALVQGSNRDKEDKLTQHSEAMKYINEEQIHLSELFSEEFHQRVTYISTNLVNDTVKSYAMNGVNKAVSSISNLKKNDEYFREKRQQHKMFHNKTNKLEKTEVISKAKIIDEKKGKPNDEIDLKALQKYTNKTIVIETYDEKGKLIKVDSIGDKKEKIRVKLTKQKDKGGHYELIGSDDKVIKNNGTDHTCLYQAVFQAENIANITREGILEGASKLRNEALNQMEGNQLHSMYQRQQVYKATFGTSTFDLEGSGSRNSTGGDTDRTQRILQRDAEKKTLDEAVKDHLEERINDLAEVHKLAKEACPNLGFDDVFQNAANFQDGTGYRDGSKTDINTLSGDEMTKLKVSEFSKVDAAHTTSLGLKDLPQSAIKDKLKYAKLKKKLANTNLLPQQVNVTLDKVIDRVQYDEMRRQYTAGEFDTSAYRKKAVKDIGKHAGTRDATYKKLRQTTETRKKIDRLETMTKMYNKRLKTTSQSSDLNQKVKKSMHN